MFCNVHNTRCEGCEVCEVCSLPTEIEIPDVITILMDWMIPRIARIPRTNEMLLTVSRAMGTLS